MESTLTVRTLQMRNAFQPQLRQTYSLPQSGTIHPTLTRT